MVRLDYSEFITNITNRSLDIQEVVKSYGYDLYAFDGPLELKCQVEDSADKTDYETNHQANANKKLNRKSPVTGRDELQIMKPEGSSATMVSHDFTDKCTWYQGSIAVTGETLTDSGDNLTFNSTNDYWIDVTHGRVYQEDDISAPYLVKVYVNDVEQTSGYTVDYESGDVTFDAVKTDPVKADYNYAGSATFTLAPDAGTVLTLEHAEVQFTKDCALNSPLNFEIWAYNPYDLPNKVPIKVLKYKSMKDIINAGNLGTGSIPAIGNLTQEVLVFPFNYITVIHLKDSQGLELRITSDNDDVLTGEWGTVTMYVMSEAE